MNVSLTSTFQWSQTNPGDTYLLIVNNQDGSDLRYAITAKTNHQFPAPLQPFSVYYWSI
ncbi:MAG: hypothetical protein Fur0021_38260 [Candidatus Promineifilaceae bacterium]